MKLRTCALLALALPLAGCQTSSGELSDVDRQALVLAAVPSNYRQTVPSSFRAIVPDPAGIRRADISTPFLGAVGAGSEVPLVCVRTEEGSEPGGPITNQTIAFVFDDGRVIDTRRNSPACATATFSPFPELPAAYAAARAANEPLRPL